MHDAGGALGQYLPGNAFVRIHRREHLSDILIGHERPEQVGHIADKDLVSRFDAPHLRKLFLVQNDVDLIECRHIELESRTPPAVPAFAIAV